MNRILLSLLLPALLVGCSTVGTQPADCPAGTQQLENCPPLGAIDDPSIAKLYNQRTWLEASEQEFDPISFGRDAEIPINHARAKFIGSDQAGGLTSLAAKLHMIENAEHTIDAVYYIYRDDLVGLAVLGALCDAVERGVDVRIMVDSLGSISFNKKWLKALQSCAVDAGFIRNEAGDLTIYKARVQAVVFNAISNVFVNHNRRSHDKMLLVDGYFDDKAFVMTGGRNISLDYYGIFPDGSPNLDTYNDAEILIGGGDAEGDADYGVGVVSEVYFSLLFRFKNNKLMDSLRGPPKDAYLPERVEMHESLSILKSLDLVAEYRAQMPEYFSSGFHDAQVRLTHELPNLVNRNVVYRAVENARLNPNSVMTVLESIPDDAFTNYQMVSPYLFAALYTDSNGEVILDEAQGILRWLEEHPNATLDIVTNSSLTSDNFFTQAVIDMDLAPRLLLSEELQAAWLKGLEQSEFNPQLVESEEWVRMVNHPRLHIYETGTYDATELGGDVEHGKQHGKYLVSDDFGFVGTTNFDYRSRLYNNEMGFMFQSKSLADDLRANTDFLIEKSHRWGSPEWLEMRRRLMNTDTLKGTMTKTQRSMYKTLRGTGLIWYF